jgi:hypothetical protein
MKPIASVSDMAIWGEDVPGRAAPMYIMGHKSCVEDYAKKRQQQSGGGDNEVV